MKRSNQEDHLITPDNSLLLIIDYQPTQVQSVNSINRTKLVKNIGIVAKIAQTYQLPIILSTVNVKTGRNQETIASLKTILGSIYSYDRTMINAWEDQEFYLAVKNSGRKKLIITALWTEACLTFPTLDALKEGYEVYPIVDAVGGTSNLAHETALRRVEQAGAKLITIPQLICELQRDWARSETVAKFVEILQEAGAFLKL